MACEVIDSWVVADEGPDGGLRLRDVREKQTIVLTPAGVDRLREHLTGGDAKE